MDTIDEATQALREAERKLQALIARAAAEAEYEAVPQLAEWARQLKQLLGDRTEDRPPPAVEPVEEAPQDHAGNGAEVRRGRERRAPPSQRPRSRTTSTSRPRKAKRKNKRADYPKFLREGDALVKIGWSKREAKPYEHKAPRTVLQALVQALARAGSGGARFTMEGLLPLRSGAGEGEIPDYQTYLTLAWLRAAGLIVQHGRQGYSLPTGTDLASAADARWNELPTR